MTEEVVVDKNQISSDELILKFASRVESILRKKIKEKLISVCLFGSTVKGKLRKGSDVDFLVVLDDAPSSYHKRVKLVSQFWRKLDKRKNTSIMTKTIFF